MRNFIFILLSGVVFTACSAGNDIFEDIGTNMASPTGLAVDSTNRRLYVTNANSTVLYDWRQGSFQVLDITNPQAPTLVGTAATLSFSGEIHLDTPNGRAYVTNRFSDGVETTSDRLLTIVTDETLTDFLSVTETDMGLNPFAVACCAATTNLLVSTSQGVLTLADISTAEPSQREVDLLLSLSTGSSLTRADIRDIVIIGSQAFLSRSQGGILVVNINELGVDGVNPVDYFISDVRTPRGMATDGTSLYITDEDTVDGTFTSRLLVLDVSSLTPLTDNTDIQVVDKDDDNLAIDSITVDGNPQEVVIAGSQAFVTSAQDDTVSVIDLTTNTAGTPIVVGDEPFGMAIDSPGDVPTTLYVGNVEGNSISIIDIPTLTLVGTYP